MLLEDVLHLDPKNAMVQLERAVCLAKTGECKDAEAAVAAMGAGLVNRDAESVHEVAKLNAL